MNPIVRCLETLILGSKNSTHSALSFLVPPGSDLECSRLSRQSPGQARYIGHSNDFSVTAGDL